MTNETNDGLLTDASQITRCAWCGEDAEYQRYHDTEWGVPTVDDQILFQKICLGFILYKVLDIPRLFKTHLQQVKSLITEDLLSNLIVQYTCLLD